MFCCQIMGEWWGPTPLRATAKIRQIFTLDDWWNLSLSLGANPGCVFFFFFFSFFFSLRLFPAPPPTLFVVVSHLEPANQLSCVLSTPIVIALSSASKKKKNHPLLHGLCTNAHRSLSAVHGKFIYFLVFEGAEGICDGVWMRVVTSLSNMWQVGM